MLPGGGGGGCCCLLRHERIMTKTIMKTTTPAAIEIITTAPAGKPSLLFESLLIDIFWCNVTEALS